LGEQIAMWSIRSFRRRSLSMCRSKRSNSVKNAACGKWLSMIPTESFGSKATLSSPPTALIARMWRGAT
jgi:hypothetical protein